MTGSVPVAVMLVAAVVLLVRSGEVRWWVAFVLVAAGVALGQIPVAEGVISAVWWFAIGPFVEAF